MASGARILAMLGVAMAAACGSDSDPAADVDAAGVGGAGAATGVGGEGADGARGSGASAGEGGASGEACTVDVAAGQCLPLAACDAGGVAVPGHCDDDGAVLCCVHQPFACDPAVMVLPNNGLDEDPGDPGCLDGMVRVESFCVDRFEASLVRGDGSPWSPYFAPAGEVVRAVSLAGAVPQAYISGDEAAAACAAAGKRLCTDAEWLRACGGPTGTTYPYGDALQPGACNDARAMHPVIEYYGTDEDWIWSELDDACIDQLHDSLERSGTRPACVSAEGAMDMMGNLHEWTADIEGTFRGGFYVDTVLNGPGCTYATTAHTTTYADYSTGFRCCADAL